MNGKTLRSGPKETDSRSRKFLNWYKDALNSKIDGKHKGHCGQKFEI